jgi:ABC-2 type transport system ATP-binding protein
MRETAIEVNGLTKRFGTFVAVNHIGFRVESGSIFGLLGANGAGKTTTIRMLCGLLAADEGSAVLDGIDVMAAPEAVKHRIGYMSQRFSLYRDLSVEENLEFFAGLYGASAAVDRSERLNRIAAVGLAGRENDLAGDLPGGLAQKLALSCAVAHHPAVLFLDEPTAGVDPASRRVFWNLIHDLAEGGTTVVVTTHYLDEAEYCDQIVMMHAGGIVASGGPGDLKERVIPGVVSGIGGRESDGTDHPTRRRSVDS